MFGEEGLVLGVHRGKVDYKGRILLPNFTHACETDSLVLLSKKKYIEVWNQQVFMKRLEEYKKDEQYADQITAIISASDVKVTRPGKGVGCRISLGRELVDTYQLQDGAILEGKGQCLRIWNPNQFEQYYNEQEEIDWVDIKNHSCK